MNTDYACAAVMPPYMAGDTLAEALIVKPPYDPSIRKADIAVRLEALQSLYEIYIPTRMTFEIYSKMYFSLQSSLRKKSGRNVILQRNENSRLLASGRNTNQSCFRRKPGIIGGSDSFSIIGVSGIGKSAAIERAIQLIGGESIILLLIIVAAIPAQAAKLKKYKAKKVTAKQIVTELKKVNKVGKTKTLKKSEMTTGNINSYKSKYCFFDKKYKQTYCTVEVFEDAYDANRRASYIDTLSLMYGTFNNDEDVPLCVFRYKNVVFRYPSTMPYKYAAKYYKNIKKIVK